MIPFSLALEPSTRKDSANLADQDKPGANDPTVAAGRLCPSCGTPNDASLSVCAQCGKALPPQVTPTRPQGRPILEDAPSLEPTNISSFDELRESESSEETVIRGGAVVPSEPTAERTGTAPQELLRDMGNRLAGRYELLDIIGEGGMGVVYHAKDLELGEDIAIKLLLPHFTKNKSDVQRFKREIVTARKITHPNVIRIHDFGLTKREAFISMELLTGGSLADRMCDPIPFTDAVSIAIGIAEGLGEAHRKGIIHRDVKPHNVMFDAEGTVKILDFGIARLATAHTTTVGFTGTPFYMAPEQADARKVTTRSDVYSLGVLLYELFTGSLPFEDESIIRLALMHANDPVPPPRSVKPDVPPELERIILKCLEKDPANRYETANEVAVALRDMISDYSGVNSLPGHLSTSVPPGRAAHPSRRPPSTPPSTGAVTARPAPQTTGGGGETLHWDQESGAAMRSQLAAPPRRRTGLWVGLALVGIAGAVAGTLGLRSLLSGARVDPTPVAGFPTTVPVTTATAPTVSLVSTEFAARGNRGVASFEVYDVRNGERTLVCKGRRTCSAEVAAIYHDFEFVMEGHKPKIIPQTISDRNHKVGAGVLEPLPTPTPRHTRVARTPRPTRRPPRPTPKATPTPVAGYGYAQLTASPFADVYIKGEKRGQARRLVPVRLKLREGRYRVDLVHPDYGRCSKRIVVRADQHLQIRAKMNGCEIQVSQ